MKQIRKFKGIWMPAALWEYPGMNITERCFFAEIDSLDHGDGCWAKNNHFSKLFKLSKNRCSEIINKMAEKGFIRIEIAENGDRRMFQNIGFGISNPPSESRLTPSESRQPIYKDRDIQLEKQENDARAIDFLKTNYPIRFQAWEMLHKRAIDDYPEFLKLFDNKVDVEGLEYTARILFARLDSFYTNWVRNTRNRQSTRHDLPLSPLKRIS